MITHHNGDLLKSGCDIICHQVNLQGIMGGGLAKQIAALDSLFTADAVTDMLDDILKEYKK